MYFMNFKIDTIFYIRLLFFNRKRCTSFEKFRIVFVQIENVKKNLIERRLMKIYKNVCIALKLTKHDDE